MRTTLDMEDDVLLAAKETAQHVHDHEAADWPAAHTRGGWATCPLTQNGCVRILSQPNHPNPVSLADALAVLRRSCGQPSHAFWHDDISLLDTTRLDPTRMHGQRQITDLYLLALAVEHDGCCVTFDAQIPLGAVRGASPRQLVSI